jgi:Secretion system C-terminal sorting domain
VQEASSGWKQYAVVAYPKEGAVGVEMRLRYYHAFDGVTYWDDVFIAPVATLVGDLASFDLLSNGGFETASPAYWSSSGAGAVWSKEQFRTPTYSLKVGGSGAASWTQAEAIRAWVGGLPGWKNPEIIVGGWVYTEGVNTAPATDDDKYQLVFQFFDAPGGTDILGGPVVLDLPQDQASSGGWIKLSSISLGAIALPDEKSAKSVSITFRKGANATGAAYLEDIFITKADDAVEGWAGDWFNANMDSGDNWYYWWNGMASGGDFPTAQPHFQYVTDDQAHTGSYSLRIETNGTNQDETPAISQRVPVTAGEPVLFSFWVKHEGNTNPTEIGTGQNNLGMTALWYDNLEGGAAGWGEIGGVDVTMTGTFNDLPAEQLIPLLVQEASSGWKQYAVVAYPKEGAVGVEMRLRYYHAFDGVTYWDDISIVPLGSSALLGTAIDDEPGTTELPESFQLYQNYPNPFNPTTTISFDLVEQGRVTLEIYNVLGQRVASLVRGTNLSPGRHTVSFDASALVSGVYLYALRTKSGMITRQMVLLK